jgi:hypothetical protein
VPPFFVDQAPTDEVELTLRFMRLESEAAEE